VNSAVAALDSLTESATAAIVSTDSFRRIREFADGLPEAFSAMCFEVRLQSGVADTDFFVALSEPAEFRRLSLLAKSERDVPPGIARESWNRIVRFSAAWLDAFEGHGHTTLRNVSSLFLEFDAPGTDTTIEPGVFLRLRGSPAPREVLALIDPFRTVTAEREESATIARCMKAVEPSGRLMHVGTVSRIGAPDLRLHFCVPRTEARRILAELYPRGCFGERWYRSLLDSGPDWIDLQLEVHHTLTSSIGMEVSFGGQPPDDRRWMAWLEPFVAEGLCDGSKISSILNWAGRSKSGTRELSHIKATLVADQLPRFKAYLGIAFSRSGP
jgi:hypothetical protein